jgi:nucleotide-binding universal stress UspA family protein
VKSILIGYDGTRAAETALARAAELAKAFGSKIVVVSVATPEPITPPGAFGLLPYYGYEADRHGLRTDEALWQQHRKSVQAFFEDAGLTIQFAGVTGQPAEQIIDLAEQQQADLIVVGTREPGLLERLFGGSVSQGVARRAHCDVLIVHSPDEE